MMTRSTLKATASTQASQDEATASTQASQDEATLAANKCTAATISKYMESVTGHKALKFEDVLESNSPLFNLRIWVCCVESKVGWKDTVKMIEEFFAKKNYSCEEFFIFLCKAMYGYENDKTLINFIGDYMKKKFKAEVVTDIWTQVIAREGCSELAQTICRYMEITYGESIADDKHSIELLFWLLNLLNESNPAPTVSVLELSHKILLKIIDTGRAPVIAYVQQLTVEQACMVCKFFKYVAHVEGGKEMGNTVMNIIFTDLAPGLNLYMLGTNYKERNELWELAKLFEHERMAKYFAENLGIPDFVAVPTSPMTFQGLAFNGILVNTTAPIPVTTGWVSGDSRAQARPDVQLEEDPLYRGVPYPPVHASIRQLPGGSLGDGGSGEPTAQGGAGQLPGGSVGHGGSGEPTAQGGAGQLPGGSLGDGGSREPTAYEDARQLLEESLDEVLGLVKRRRVGV